MKSIARFTLLAIVALFASVAYAAGGTQAGGKADQPNKVIYHINGGLLPAKLLQNPLHSPGPTTKPLSN